MTSRLVDLLGIESNRTADLQRLMLMCQTEAQEIFVVCVGAGDAFINRYWPVLRLYAAQKRIKLVVADTKPIQEIARENPQKARESGDEKTSANLTRLYDEFISVIDSHTEFNGDVKFADLSNDHDRKWYSIIRADMVFVLVPDEAHISTAKGWLKRSTLILIEKPYNRDLTEAVEFGNDLSQMMNKAQGGIPTTLVIPFDHYLAKISDYDFNKERHRLSERIGRLVKIDFSILEERAVELWRAQSLRAGMIYDLFSHVLAMLSVELDLSTFRANRVKEIRVARHTPHPDGFDSDTFAYFDFDLPDYNGRSVNVSGPIGKGVGRRDEKFINFIGEFGSISCDLDSRGSKRIIIEEGSRSRMGSPIYQVKGGHQEFLEALLVGEYNRKPIGGLTGEAAIEILRIMNRIRDRIPPSIYEYDVGSDKETIRGAATPVRV